MYVVHVAHRLDVIHPQESPHRTSAHTGSSHLDYQRRSAEKHLAIEIYETLQMHWLRLIEVGLGTGIRMHTRLPET